MSWPWRTVKFGELFLTPVRNGVYKAAEYQGRGTRIVNMKELFGYEFIGNQEMRRIELDSTEKRKFLLMNGDLLFARRSLVEDGSGKTSIVQGLEGELTFESSIIRVRLDESRVSPLFYYYFLGSTVGRPLIIAISSGVNVKGIRGSDLKRVSLPFPPLQVQQKIARTISAYDDLIENNLKRIKLLEEMAQLTYEEWFVRMKFPGYEDVTVDAETGLPEGWKYKEFNEFGEVLTGKTPSTSKQEYYDGEVPFIKTPDMSRSAYVLDTSMTLSSLGGESQKKKYVPKNTLLVSCIGTAGEIGLTSTMSQFNQQINGIVCTRESDVFFLYCFSKHLKPLLEALGSNGATMTNVNKSKFERIKVITPTDNLLQHFTSQVVPLFKGIENNLRQNQLLKEARDILLPRLMTGLINVDDIEMPQASEVA